jgi:hypothetical protein
MKNLLLASSLASMLVGLATPHAQAHEALTDAQFVKTWRAMDDAMKAGDPVTTIGPDCNVIREADAHKDHTFCVSSYIWVVWTFRLTLDKPMYSHEDPKWVYTICDDHNYCDSRDHL